MKNHKIKIIAGILLVFFLGTVTGGLISHIYLSHRIEKFMESGPPPKFMHKFMGRLLNELDLTPSQRKDVEKIAENLQDAILSLRKKYHPEFQETIEKHLSEIKQLLTSDQQKKMELIQERMKKRWHRQFFDKRRPNPEHFLKKLKEDVNLSEAQAAQIYPIVQKFFHDQHILREKFEADPHKNRQMLHGERRRIQETVRKQIEAILTPDQCSLFKEFLKREQKRQFKKGPPPKMD